MGAWLAPPDKFQLSPSFDLLENSYFNNAISEDRDSVFGGVEQSGH